MLQLLDRLAGAGEQVRAHVGRQRGKGKPFVASFRKAGIGSDHR